jgi:hypothetical protein
MEDEEKLGRKDDEQKALENVELTKQSKLEEKLEHKGESISEGTQNKLFSWRDRTHQEKTNLILVLISLISIVLIFWMTSESNSISREALKNAEESNRLTRKSFELSQRVYLKIDSVTTNKKGNELEFSILNFGHTTCNEIMLTLICAVVDKRGNKILEISDSLKQKCIIPPNNAAKYGVYITLPEFSNTTFNNIKVGKYIPVIGGTLVYDTGFKTIDSLHICRSYRWTDKSWIRCGTAADINFIQKKRN